MGCGSGRWWLVIVLLSVGQVHAAERYCRADIFMGRVTSVQGDAQAQRFPVRQPDGAYQFCDVFMGRVSGCEGDTRRSGFPVACG